MYSSQDPRFLPAVALKTLTSAMAYTKAETETTCLQAGQCPSAHFLLLVPTPEKSSQHQKRSCLELKCAVFLRGREMPHRKYYKELNLSAVHTLLRPHALCSGNAVTGLHTAGKTGTGLFR